MADEEFAAELAHGRANQANFRLVTNWCAHVRIGRYGGVGMLEASTGVPIGHFGPECDHAGPSGSYSYDIRQSAVDFYDKHCRRCSLRKPLGEPNLSQWVAERDAAVAEAAAQEAAANRAAADALNARREERQQLRLGLAPAAVDVIDQLDELDGAGSATLIERFVETARLAPEAFPAAIVDYLFRQLEGEQAWVENAALAALNLIGADPARLVRVAAGALGRGNFERATVRAFVKNRAVARAEDVAAVFRALVELAEPDRQPFSTMRRAQRAPLALVARSFPEEVQRQIRGFLDNGAPVSVGLAARAIDALVRPAYGVVQPFVRDIVAAWVRATWIPGRRALSQDARAAAARDLEASVAALFGRDPETVDDLLQKFKAGASPDGEARIYKTYHWILRDRSFRDERPAGKSESIAFERLLRAAPVTTDWDVLNEIVQAFDRKPGRLLSLATAYSDELLGTGIRMDERLTAFDAQPKAPTMLEELERRNHRSSLDQLRDTFVAWAAAGVAATGDLSGYLTVLENIPESQGSFAACMIEHVVGLATNVAGLNAVLPVLYAGLVGASVAGRGAAVTAVGKLPAELRRHAPDLLYEAFIPALSDRYIYVHRSAVNTLRDIRLPEAFSRPVRLALANLVAVYGAEGKESDFILKCIELLAGRYLSEAALKGPYGATLVSMLAKLPSWSLSSHMRHLARKLGRADGMTALLIRILTDPESTDHTIEAILDAMAELPNDVLYAEREALAVVTAGPSWETHRRVHGVVELLGRAGAWREAVEVAERAIAEIPQTRRERPVRRRMELVAAAARYERALSDGDAEAARRAGDAWRALLATIEQESDAA